jgi:membrane protein implicated in regulation of membrane protease activity
VNPKSIRTLGQVAILLFIAAGLMMSPPLQVFLAILAALCAFIPAAFGSGKWRVIGIVVMILSVALAITQWPKARKEMQDYRTRGSVRQ